MTDSPAERSRESESVAAAQLHQRTGQWHRIGRDGELYVPQRYVARLENRPLKLLRLEPGQSFNPVRKYLLGGGLPVLSGDWQAVLDCTDHLAESCTEKRSRRGRKEPDPVADRLMLLCHGDSVQCAPAQAVPFLLNFVAEPLDSAGQLRFVVSVRDFQRIQRSLGMAYHVQALGESLHCHHQVLAPRSQETTTLVHKALLSVVAALPEKVTALDMGCGSGVLTFLTAKVLRTRLNQLFATDCLFEALGSTRYNLARLAATYPEWEQQIHVTAGGDLFAPVPEEAKLDLVVFNAPWVNAKAVGQARLATNDAGLSTVQRFLEQLRPRLAQKGRLLLCYADQSGPRAVKQLEQALEHSGYWLVERFRDRIRTSGRNKRWESIFVYHVGIA